MTWAIGGLVGVYGYRLITRTAYREAEARVQDTSRVACRLIQAEVDRLPSAGVGTAAVRALDHTRSSIDDPTRRSSQEDEPARLA
jgi:hypothetical protein